MLINWGTPVEFLDKELLPVAANSRTRRLFVDCLFRVRLKSGQNAAILIHIEVQGTSETRFPKRMFRYFARLFVKYDLPTFSLAIFTDDNPRW